jgi:hypothetical protein
VAVQHRDHRGARLIVIGASPFVTPLIYRLKDGSLVAEGGETMPRSLAETDT